MEGQTDLGRRIRRTGWGQVSGEWDEQQKIAWCREDPSRQQHPETDKRKRRRNASTSQRNRWINQSKLEKRPHLSSAASNSLDHHREANRLRLREQPLLWLVITMVTDYDRNVGGCHYSFRRTGKNLIRISVRQSIECNTEMSCVGIIMR